MAHRHKKRTPKPKVTHLSHKQITALSASKYKVPFYLLWGIAGAESTWGKNPAGRDNLFGLVNVGFGIDKGNWKQASEESAKTLRTLFEQYGSWPAAVEHYSGNNYTIGHPTELAKSTGVKVTTTAASLGLPEGPAAEEILKGLGGALGLGGSGPAEKLGEAVGPSVGGALGSIIPQPIVEGFEAETKVVQLLTSPEFWIRAAEAVGGILLLYIALKALTGSGVTDLPGGSAAKEYGKMAAFKRLPPKTRVK